MKKIKTLHNIFLKSEGVSTDTREDVRNKLFFALSGSNFNGNKFAHIAIEKGALIAIIDDPEYYIADKCLVVENALEILQGLANYHRQSSNAKVLAITGSNGKTTTKELISTVLSSSRNIIATKGNLNNHIGVPLTLLTIKDTTEIAVIEMGANHIGEIGDLCKIAMPDIGIITNIGKAHLEGFGSYEGVITAKNELYEYIIKNKGDLIVNSDDQLLMDLSKNSNKVTYGKNNAFIEGELFSSKPYLSLKWGNEGVIKNCNTNIYGNYNFYNILAAITSGLYFKIDHDTINQSIESYIPKNNRSQKLETNSNLIILDAYNANPYSMKEAITSFFESNYPDPWLILGDMFELGKYSKEEHQNIVELIKDFGFKNVILTGKEFTNTINHSFSTFVDRESLIGHLSKLKLSNAQILIKGSRGMKMESLLEKL